MREWIDLFEAQSFKMPIAEIMLDRRAVVIVLKDIVNGLVSHSHAQPVALFSERDGLRLGDGYHRVIQAVLTGKSNVTAVIDSRYATDLEIPQSQLWTVEDGFETLGFTDEEIQQAKNNS